MYKAFAVIDQVINHSLTISWAISVAYLHLCITTRKARCRVSPEAAASVGAVRRSNQPTKVAPHTTATSLSLYTPTPYPE